MKSGAAPPFCSALGDAGGLQLGLRLRSAIPRNGESLFDTNRTMTTMLRAVRKAALRGSFQEVLRIRVLFGTTLPYSTATFRRGALSGGALALLGTPDTGSH